MKGGLLKQDGKIFITADSDPQAALTAAMNTWSSVSSSSVHFQPIEVGPTKASGGDRQNSFSFDDSDEIRSIVGSAIAITRAYSRSDGGLVDTDIYFSPEYTFSTTLYAGTMDIQAIATHELGHALGGGHSNLFSSTMFPFGWIEQTFSRRLSDDDVALVSSVYPATGSPPALGIIMGAIAFEGGGPVRAAAVIATDVDRGTIVSAISSYGDGRYTLAGIPPGNYHLHAEPIGSLIDPSDLNLDADLVDLHFPATVYGGVSAPQLVAVGPGLTATADFVVSSKPPTLTFDFSWFSDSSGSIDYDLLPSGQGAEITVFGSGFDDSMRPEDILVLGPGIVVRPGSLRVSADIGIVSFIVDIAPREDWSMAFFGIRRGEDILFTNSVRITPGGPFFRPSGVTNGSGSRNGGLAPGEIASLYGAGLGPAAGVAADPSPGHLPREAAGVTLLVDGVPAPLFYVSAGQINFLVPFEVAGRPSIRLSVRLNGLVSEEATLPVLEAAPGVFPFVYGWAILNQDWTVNSPVNPARPGSVVMVYCTGLGLVTPAVATGDVTPSTPLSLAPGVTASLNELDAPVYFAGLAPGFVGLAQVNVMVPESAPPGELHLVLKAHGQASRDWATVAVK